jgi:hypothetical protein
MFDSRSRYAITALQLEQFGRCLRKFLVTSIRLNLGHGWGSSSAMLKPINISEYECRQKGC